MAERVEGMEHTLKSEDTRLTLTMWRDGILTIDAHLHGNFYRTSFSLTDEDRESIKEVIDYKGDET